MSGESLRIGGGLDARLLDENWRILRGAALLGGQIGGQVFYGGKKAGEHLELHSNPSKDGLIKLGDNAAFNEATTRLGIGTQGPTVTVDVVSAADVTMEVRAFNSNSSGTAAVGALRAQGSTANVALLGHGSGRTVARCGITLGGWTELATVAGSGLLIDPLGAVPIVFGTNNVELARIDAAGAAANQTNLLLHEGSPRTQRRVQWKDGATIAAGDKVMVLV